LIGYILVSILATHSDFKRFFTIYLYSSIVASAGALLSVLIVRYVRGLETIREVQDATFSFGLGFLAISDNRFIQVILRSLDLFNIWFLVLVAMGLMYVFKMERNHAIMCVIPFWILTVLVMFGGSIMSSL
jgi:hypothetical protein